jgi:predicted SprT family Zn-dependent metalloprotease
MVALDHSTNAVVQSIAEKSPQYVSYDSTKVDEQDQPSPTQEYSSYQHAYDYFTVQLFHGRLPPCLITLQRKSHTRGYYAGKRFASRQDEDVRTDEIALNPDTFEGRSDKDILSTLVHEQVHLWQAHHGKPSRGGYHNREWARRMVTIGLQPISLDNPAKMTGQRVTHVIVPGGRFDRATDALLATGFQLRWQSPVMPGVRLVEFTPKQTADSKVKYSCPQCSANAWAKPNSHLMCAQCFQKHVEWCEHWMYADEIMSIARKYIMRPVRAADLTSLEKERKQ